jgi:transcriptional regulator with XRE-family HTH domain
VSPDEIKALRKELKCTPRELGAALGVGQDVVMAWEEEKQFPTKRFIAMMEELRTRGPGALPRMRGRAQTASPMKLLSDPELWRVVRKILAHPPLFDRVKELCDSFPDPE